jgi:hypothetical protein
MIEPTKADIGRFAYHRTYPGGAETRTVITGFDGKCVHTTTNGQGRAYREDMHWQSESRPAGA